MDISSLKSFINEKVKISEEDFNRIIPFLYSKEIRKNEIVLRQGEFCQFIGFLNRGLIRSYYDDESGKEITTKFFFENCLFTDVEGFLENVTSTKTFVAVEASETLMMKKSDLWQIFEIIPKLEKIFSLILIEDLKYIIQNSESVLNESPEIRYLKFQQQFPTAFNRISLKYTASYLGIEPQSLSRIRNRIAKK